ncbi:YafY family transcriptional regulator [Chloroflexia bacterium SDU3-3]|nr:YafY family transcriptional regulator [Chloroflexia bacterium SDU3-3]
MANTATRLITLIMLLQRQPNQTAAQLAQELAVSVRTVQRYIAMLEEIGIPVYAERGPHGGYALVRGYKMPPLIFTPEEAVAVSLGTSLLEEIWGRLYQEGARGALAKIENVLPDDQRHEVAWARQNVLSIGTNWLDPNLAVSYLGQLRDAIRERQRICIHYRTRSQPEAEQRDVDPYKLVSRWGWQYCIGYCHARQEPRTFRLDRIVALKRLDQTFPEPTHFDLAAYLASNPFFQATVRVRLRFGAAAAAVVLDNRVYWESIEEQPDGALVVSFTAPDLEAAAGQVLRVGLGSTIIEPEGLRALVHAQASALANHFGTEQDLEGEQ